MVGKRGAPTSHWSPATHAQASVSMVFPPHRVSVGYRGSAWWEGTRARFRVLLGPARGLLSAWASGGLSPHERPSPIQWPLSAGPFVQEAATSCRIEKGAGGRKPKCGGQPCLGSCLGGSAPSAACWVDGRAGISPPGKAVVGAGFVRSELTELGEGPRKVPRLGCPFQVCCLLLFQGTGSPAQRS